MTSARLWVLKRRIGFGFKEKREKSNLKKELSFESMISELCSGNTAS